MTSMRIFIDQMKRLSFLLVLCSIATLTMGQGKCPSDAQTASEAEVDPDYAEGLEAYRALAEEFEQGLHDAGREDFKEVVIPVVVHVLYRLEENNISYDQILSQIDVLNRDFNWGQGDKNKIPEVWRDLGERAKFTFRLADRDPKGNFTNGVTRKQTDVENIGTEEIYHIPARGGVKPWNRAFYMNIWVCELEGNSLGFAILPSSKMSLRDGIVISPRAFGTLGTAKSPYNGGRTMVHEVGHYFGLRHLWGDDNESCSTSDLMDDTPTQRSENFGCQTYPSISCGNDPHGDMFMNFMDYSNDTCALLFTKRQVEFMQLIMKTNRRAMFYSNGVTAVDEVAVEGWRLFPNPSDGEVTVAFGADLPDELNVINALGEVVHTMQPAHVTEHLSLGHLPSGVYYLRSPNKTQTLILH